MRTQRFLLVRVAQPEPDLELVGEAEDGAAALRVRQGDAAEAEVAGEGAEAVGEGGQGGGAVAGRAEGQPRHHVVGAGVAQLGDVVVEDRLGEQRAIRLDLPRFQ